MSGVRGRLASELTAEKALRVIEDAMESTRQAWSFCPRCKAKVQADFPDHGARLKALEMWFEQGFGRPGTGSTLESSTVVGGRETLEQLEDMSMDALAGYCWSLQSEEERAADRRLVEELGATVFPPGFAEALERLERLSSSART